MGIDYLPFSLKPGSDRSEFGTLAAQQAQAFQAIPYWWDSVPGACNIHHTLEKIHKPAYSEARRKLKEMIILHDDSFRTYAITKSIVFPLAWRIQAFRTFLPEELSAQLTIWQSWISDIKAGERLPILEELYCYYAFKCLNECKIFRSIVIDWFSKPRSKQRLSENYYKNVLEFEFPEEPRLFWMHSATLGENSSESHIDSAYYSSKVNELLALVKEWNYNSSGKWKFSCYLKNYQSLALFIESADIPYIEQFFQWCQGNVINERGIFLDY